MKYDYYITGVIGEEYDWWTGERGTTADMVKDFLDGHKDKEVNILVSSPGGLLDQGMTIGELIAAHGQCNMYIVGMTASAATLLCMKAKTVNIATGSLMLIHNSSLDIGFYGSANKQAIDKLVSKFKAKRDELDTYDKAIASLYSYRNHKSIEENMKKMDEEKWMLADEAKDFGIVDSVFDDEQSTAAAKNVRNRAAAKAGFTEHFALPNIPVSRDSNEGFWKRFRRDLGGIVGLVNNIAPIEDNDNNNQTKTQTMKKIVMNCMCAILGVTDLEAADDGKVTLTDAQLQKVEDGLKAKDTSIASLTKERDEAKNALTTAENAKAQAEKDKKTAEDKLADLQKEFDAYKNEQGDSSKAHAKVEEGDTPKNAKELLDDVKDLL